MEPGRGMVARNAMSNQYNGARPVPVVPAADRRARLVVPAADRRARLVVRRDTWEDLVSRDVD